MAASQQGAAAAGSWFEAAADSCKHFVGNAVALVEAKLVAWSQIDTWRDCTRFVPDHMSLVFAGYAVDMFVLPVEHHTDYMPATAAEESSRALDIDLRNSLTDNEQTCSFATEVADAEKQLDPWTYAPSDHASGAFLCPLVHPHYSISHAQSDSEVVHLLTGDY